MRLLVEAVSDKGIQRDMNEDMILVGDVYVRDSEYVLQHNLSSSIFYTLVADGMGGHEHGEFASEYTLHRVADFKVENEFERDFQTCIAETGASLNEMATTQGQLHFMGTTLTGFVWENENVWLVNAGDSRVYRYRDDSLEQLSVDQDLNHFYNKDMGQEGLALYNCVGGGCDSEVTVEQVKVRVGDTYLICSDGLSDMVDDFEIETLLTTADIKATDLVNAANNNGGCDNISVILIRVIEDDTTTQEAATVWNRLVRKIREVVKL